MSTIRTVIIDDEPEARRLLARLLGELSQDLEVVGEADDVVSGRTTVITQAPDLIFLDINLKTGTGFDLLDRLPDLDAEVIFVTAYDQYALRAFDFAAIGYLLKPLRVADLNESVNRYLQRRASGSRQRLATLKRNRGGPLEHIVVPDLSGFRVLKLPQLIYLQGEINYTRFFLADGSQLLSSKTLKEYEKLLTDSGFCRIHQSYLINLSHVASYQRGEGGVVILDNGAHLDVSRRRKSFFMKHFVG